MQMMFGHDVVAEVNDLFRDRKGDGNGTQFERDPGPGHGILGVPNTASIPSSHVKL